MRFTNKPIVLIEWNFDWLFPDINIKNKPGKDKFDRATEQQKFLELVKMRSQGKIDLIISIMAIESFKRRHKHDKNLVEKVISYLKENTTCVEHVLFEGSETDIKVKRAEKLLYATGEKQDDPLVYTLIYFIDPQVTHMVTFDVKLYKDKSKQYKNILQKDKELREWIDCRRKVIGPPSKIIEDVENTFFKD